MTRMMFAPLAVAACAALVQSSVSAQGASVPPPAQMAVSDSTFMKNAAQDGKTEVALAELAQTAAQSAAVKTFATRLHDDHEKAGAELASLAASRHVTLPDEMNAVQKSTKAKLSKLTGAAFDRAYIDEMVSAHKTAIALFTRATESKDGDVKVFALKTLPTLKTHLADAEALQKSLASTSH